MEYMNGGDIGSLLDEYESLYENVARFYIAEIIMAVHHLHQVKIIHRDLKPENILLSADGHIKLIDFGLSEIGFVINQEQTMQNSYKIFSGTLQQNSLMIQSKKKENSNLNKIKKLRINDFQEEKISKQSIESCKTNFTSRINLRRAFSFSKQFLKTSKEFNKTQFNCKKEALLETKKEQKNQNRIIGTPDYIAIEVFKGGSLKNPALDVGVILFEMLVGCTPFHDDSIELIFENIKNMRVPWDQIPVGNSDDCLSPEAVDLIKQFMNPEPLKRLGAQGIEEIEIHPFFKGFQIINNPVFVIIKGKKLKEICSEQPPLKPSPLNLNLKYEINKNYKNLSNSPFAKPHILTNEIQQFLKQNAFAVTRADILDEENQKKILEVQGQEKNRKEKLQEIQEFINLNTSKYSIDEQEILSNVILAQLEKEDQ